MKVAESSSDTDRDALKRAAAEAAVQLVENDMVVGLGSGSTAAFAVEALARRQQQGLRFVGIPTSERTAAQAVAANIPLTSFSEHRQIDLTIDGADEVERGTLNLIKGLGGALLREKIVAAASHRNDGETLYYRARTRDCRSCLLKSQCCPKAPLRRLERSIYEEARDVARALGKTEAFERSRRDRKRVEMLFAHLKRIFRLGRLRLRGPRGAQFEFTLAAIAQNLRRLARLVLRPPPVAEVCFA